MTVAAIVPAAGRGERLGPGAPKAMRPLGGTPMLVHAVRAMSRARLVDLVVVAAPPGGEAEVVSVLASHDVGKEVRVIAGGATRQESVRRALESLPADVDVVLLVGSFAWGASNWWTLNNLTPDSLTLDSLPEQGIAGAVGAPPGGAAIVRPDAPGGTAIPADQFRPAAWDPSAEAGGR